MSHMSHYESLWVIERQTYDLKKMFEDKIHSMEVATLLTQMTKSKKRKNMGHEAFKIWARKFLKQIIRPEYYIMVATNVSQMEPNAENMKYFGTIVDEVTDLVANGQGSLDLSNQIDAIIKKSLSMLLRNFIIYT